MASWASGLVGAAVGFAAASAIQSSRSTTSFLADPSLARLASAGLPQGGQLALGLGLEASNILFGGSQGRGTDWRLKVSCPAFGFGGVMASLGEQGGVIFPHTPTVNVVYQANYSAQRFTHSNYPHYTYENSEVQAIQITAEFTAQNRAEADYVLGCIYFFRAATKMYFANSANAGNPPPLVFLDGYGKYYFPHVPCLVTQFSHSMPNDVDYIESSGTRIPTISQIQLQLQPAYSKNNIANNFDLDGFAAGGLVNRGFL